MNTCSSCKYFKDGGEDEYNTCRRYPETLIVNPDYWCGEYDMELSMLKKTVIDAVREKHKNELDDAFKEFIDTKVGKPKPDRPEKKHIDHGMAFQIGSAAHILCNQKMGWNECCDAWEEWLEGEKKDYDPEFYDHLRTVCQHRDKRWLGKAKSKYTYLCLHPTTIPLHATTCRKSICPLIHHER